MPNRLLALSLLIASLMALPVSADDAPAKKDATAKDASDATRQTAHKLDVTVPMTLDYLLYLPPDYDQQEQVPLVLFLHGAGERGNDLDKVKVHGPPKLVAQGKDFPFILVSPQCPKDEWWEPVRLTALLDEVTRTHKVDPDRVYVTGLSMGGFGTWSLAAYTPQRFAAIIPICGGGERFMAERIAPIPTWVFHGAKDGVVPPERSIAMVEAITLKGGHPKLTLYANAGHDSWTATYDDPAVYEWMLSQRRTSSKP